MHTNILHRIAVMWVPMLCQLCATCSLQHATICRANRKCSRGRATNSRFSTILLLFPTFSSNFCALTPLLLRLQRGQHGVAQLYLFVFVRVGAVIEFQTQHRPEASNVGGKVQRRSKRLMAL